MNLRIALEEIVRRLARHRAAARTRTSHFHSTFNRAPLSVPITFAPGARELPAR